MFVAVACTGAIRLELAVFADEAVFADVFFHTKLLLAVYHTSKVRFFAFIAFIKGA